MVQGRPTGEDLRTITAPRASGLPQRSLVRLSISALPVCRTSKSVWSSEAAVSTDGILPSRSAEKRALSHAWMLAA